MKKWLVVVLPILAIVFLIGVGVERTIVAFQERGLAVKSRDLGRLIKLADEEPDHQAAIELYERIDPAPPEVQLRILVRQWSQALEKLREIRRIRDNTSLRDEAPVMFEKLGDLLEDMNDRCQAVAAADPVPAEAAWRAYNLQSAARLLTAFTVMETERNTKKVTAILREAISHLKAAIEAVDRASPGLNRNIPRWNTELLYSGQILTRFQLVEPDTERQLDLGNNLEAILPDQGGYAPGEAIDRKIRK